MNNLQTLISDTNDTPKEMADLSSNALLTVDESLFYCLLGGPGNVRIDIVTVEKYFLPFVSFSACVDVPDVHYGLILQNGTDLLAAETASDLIRVLRDMTFGSGSLQINWSGA